MNRRLCSAVVGSVLLHLGLIGGVRWGASVDGLRAGHPGQLAEPVLVIQARLLPAEAPPVAVAFVAPRPRAPKVAKSGHSAGPVPLPVPMGAQRVVALPDGPATHSASALAPVETSDADGHPPVPAVRKPLMLDLPANQVGHALDAAALQAAQTSDRLRGASPTGGSVAVQEAQGPMGERRATVTTPWGRYCMRERRSAGPYDARRDRGMDTVTCPGG